jgi:hypothetical protein
MTTTWGRWQYNIIGQAQTQTQIQIQIQIQIQTQTQALKSSFLAALLRGLAVKPWQMRPSMRRTSVAGRALDLKPSSLQA